MIHTVKEEVYISIYLIAFGIYLISTYDVLLYTLECSKMPRVIKVIIEIIYCLVQLLITYLFSYKLASGYIPIYFILFLILGFILYIYFLKKPLLKTINYYGKKVRPVIGKIFLNVLLPTTVIVTLKKLILKLIKSIKFKITKIKIKKALKKNIKNNYSE